MSQSSELAGPVDFPNGGGEMEALMRAHDWDASPVGRPDSWPRALRTVLRIMLSSRYAMWLAWGKELTFFCNDAYRPTLGDKQGWALGASARTVWAEIWPDIGPRIEHVLRSGAATWDEGLLLFLERRGYPEETYHTFSYSPAPDDAGAVGGMLCVVAEETERVIGERRLATLADFAATLAAAHAEAEVCAAIVRGLAGNQKDLPFTLTYLFDETGERARLVAATGMPAGHPLAPAAIDRSGPGAVWLDGLELGHGMKEIGALDRLAPLGGGVPSGEAWTTPPRKAVVLPIARQGQDRPAGFLVAGANPFRPLDDGYADFLRLVAGQIAAGLAGAWAYEAERRRAEALAEIDRAKTAFFSNVSHEFRTPLALMLAPLEDALADAPPGDRQRERLEVAHRNAQRLLRLVNSLLEFSRIEAGRVQASYEPTDLAALTGELASVFRSATERAGLTLTVDCPPLDEAVLVDREMWEKIVLNLLSNAFKFTFAGGIEVRLRRAGGNAELAVRDTGTGIPAAELPHLFDRFHRVDGAQGRTHEGTGIGLALVQELTRLHGGTVAVRSELGVGTTFTVSIPFGAAHLPADRLRAAPGRVRAPDGATPFIEEALRWLPDGFAEGDAPGLPLGSFPELPQADGPPPGDGPRARILLADDNADMRDYLRRLLAPRYEVRAVTDGAAALEAVRERRPDLVLSDVMMPRLDGFGLVRALRADVALADLPVILLSARAGEEASVEGLEAGADDYLVKPFTARELLARVAANLNLARTRREAAEAVRASERQLSDVLQAMGEAFYAIDREERFLLASPKALQAWDKTAEEVLGRRITEVLPHVEGGEMLAALRQALATGRPVRTEAISRALAGRWMEQDVYPSPEGAAVTFRDIHPRKQAEAELRRLNETLEARVEEEIAARQAAQAQLAQAQKMEAVGQLTGGIAHDFNNLLTVVMGGLETIGRRLSEAPSAEDVARMRRSADAAMQGTRRAATLTQRLLAFSRKQALEPRPVDANRLVFAMSEILRRSLGERVAFETVLAGGLWRTRVDPNQLENALLNLAVNARDAMPDGGRLTMETANAYLDEAYAAQIAEGLAPGQYVLIAVTDTGTGMDRATMEHVFEPFFTTKGVGEGSGLGLSQVYGFVRQSDGHVKIYSEPGHGTTVRIYLPRLLGQEDADVEPGAADDLPETASAETILVVEDDDAVRAYSTEALRDLGYRILEAPHAQAALDILDRERRVDLLFTDVGLPGAMNGRHLADEAARRRPGLKVLFTTGYARNAIVHNGTLDAGVRVIGKPFTYTELATKIRAVLDDGG